MDTSDVRSIDSLRDLKASLVLFASDSDNSVQQIRSSLHRVAEHFSVTMPAYWKQQTRIAEQKLSESLDNLSNQRGSSSQSASPSASDAKQRVDLATRRLKLCEEKQRLAHTVAIQFGHIQHTLAGPIAEVAAQATDILPAAAIHLATLIDHLDQYTT